MAARFQPGDMVECTITAHWAAHGDPAAKEGPERGERRRVARVAMMHDPRHGGLIQTLGFTRWRKVADLTNTTPKGQP